jgi:hypothetical protein
MQHMPDKDFDNLFKDKFANAEVEPSMDLWTNINDKLAPQPKKIKLPIFWMAAASVVAVLSFTLLVPKGDKIYLQGSSEITLTKVVEKPFLAQKDVEVGNAEAMGNRLETTKPTRSFVSHRKQAQSTAVEDRKNIYVAMQPSVNDEHLPIKKTEAKPLDIVPQTILPEETTVYMANNIAAGGEDLDHYDEPKERNKGIRNVGDLVNYVVDKVDKRENKLIKFETDDDENTSIIGINIGFLRFNKKNR